MDIIEEVGGGTLGTLEAGIRQSQMIRSVRVVGLYCFCNNIFFKLKTVEVNYGHVVNESGH